MASSEAYILSAVRTPTGKFLGALAGLSAIQLGATAIGEAVRRAGVEPAAIDEVIMGNVVQAGVGQAPARQAAIAGGVPDDVPAYTVNKVCGSGLKAVMLAAQAIRAGDCQLVVAGGMESMSNAPYLLPKARTGYRLGDDRVVDAVIHDGLWCAFEGRHMGELAELIAERYGISRQEQDQFALRSHERAVRAQREGWFAQEIVPAKVPGKGGETLVDVDEPPRPDTSLEALARLKPAFRPGGTVTAGNAPGLSDGASALVVASGTFVDRYGLRPIARIVSYASAAVEPKWLFAAPPVAVRRLLELSGLRLQDFDLIEINEAFSAQVLANARELDWDWEKVNVCGGAVALGHPIGASGARILTTLLHSLRRTGGRLGLAALCLGGGGAVAMAVEAL
jgi:acetyl-CoA C-acetyltransferase